MFSRTSTNESSTTSDKVFRVDKFKVPQNARDEFLAAVKKTHTFLRTLPGFERDFIFEQFSGPGKFNFMTVVEWKSLDVVNEAKIAVQEMQKNEGFNPGEIMKRNEITSDFSFCKSLIF